MPIACLCLDTWILERQNLRFSERNSIPHHLLDIRNPNELFTAGDFYRSCREAIKDIELRNKHPIVVGGSGFYLKTLLFGLWDTPPSNPEIKAQMERQSNEELFKDLLTLDPESAKKIGSTDRYRLIRFLELNQTTKKSPALLQSELPRLPDPKFHFWTLDRSSDELSERISRRTELMLTQGLIEEVKMLQASYPHARPLQATGYLQGPELSESRPPGRTKD